MGLSVFDAMSRKGDSNTTNQVLLLLHLHMRLEVLYCKSLSCCAMFVHCPKVEIGKARLVLKRCLTDDANILLIKILQALSQ